MKIAWMGNLNCHQFVRSLWLFTLEGLAGTNAFYGFIYAKRAGFLEELNINKDIGCML
jgi:hypothetical protein